MLSKPSSSPHKISTVYPCFRIKFMWGVCVGGFFLVEYSNAANFLLLLSAFSSGERMKDPVTLHSVE